MAIALIDADILVYRGGYACQKTIYQFIAGANTHEFYNLTLKEVIHRLHEMGFKKKDGTLKKVIRAEPVAYACHTMKMMIQDILDMTKCSEFQLFLTSDDKSNYRFDIATLKPYKGNRTQPKPIHYDTLRDYLVHKWNSKMVYEQEADDAIGIMATKCREYNMPFVICTIDKDLNMIPGEHYNFVTREFYTVSDPGFLELSGNSRKLIGGGIKWLYAQMLLGDNADNIPGITGYGPVKVFKTLNKKDTEAELQEAVLNVYKQQYKDKALEAFSEVMSLLWIRRYEGEMKRVS